MLTWTDKFATGHSLIDAQHRMLISYVNNLESLSQNTNPTPQEIELFYRFLVFLEDYIVVHFREEEECTFRFRCPNHRDNKRAHTEFLDFYRGFERQFRTVGYRPEVVKEMYDTCVIWIEGHILRIDVQLRPCQTPFYEPDPPE
jgi:hemerythrin